MSDTGEEKCLSEAKDLGLNPSPKAAGTGARLPRAPSLGFLVFQVEILSRACVSTWWILKHPTDVN